ncbi:DUF7832 domain-containing protein [Pedobacter caeni]|nr:hypothetical protein [Pedobacter caeni]
MAKYDDASWHYGGDFPKDLPQINGATHIGMSEYQKDKKHA